MYFQFLIEDKSTKQLVDHVMDKMKALFSGKEILYGSKSLRVNDALRRL